MRKVFLSVGRVVAALMLMSASSARAAENALLFVDDFNQRPLHSAPPADQWTIFPTENNGRITIDGIGNDATPNWCTLKGTGEMGMRSRAFALGKEAWVRLSIRMTGGQSCAVALCDDNGQFPFQLRLVRNQDNSYDAVVLCRSGDNQPLSQTVSQNMPMGQWYHWIFGVKTVDNNGYYSVYRDDQPLAQSILGRMYTPLEGINHLQVSGDDADFSFSDVSVYPRSPLAALDQPDANDYIEPQNHGKVDYDFQVSQDGGMKLRIGRMDYQVRCAFSRIGGGMQWIGKSDQADSNDVQWPVQIRKEPDGAYRVTAINDQYTLIRRIQRLDNRIAVSDQLINRTDGLLGIRFLNEISSAFSTDGSRLCGTVMPAPSSLNQPERPFIQVMTADNSLGMITRDDVYRNQAVCYAEASAFGIRDDYFTLAPQASYTVQWELYPVDSASPFDFINTVRQVWESDRLTIPGLFAFVYPQRTWMGNGKRLDQMSVSDMKQWLDVTGIDTIGFVLAPDPGGPDAKTEPFKWPFEFNPVEAYGEDYYRTSLSQSFWKPILERLRQAKPDIKLLPYFHPGLNPLDARFNDCRILLQDGKQKEYRFYDRYVRYGYYPTFTNSFGRVIEKVFDDLHDDFGSDGMYWDEFGHGNLSVYMDGVPDWDGHSAVIDPSTNNVTQKVTNLCLITQPIRTRLVEKVLSRGEQFWTNWQPTTQADMALNIPHFLEYFRPPEAARGYLSSPLALGGYDAKSNADIMGQVHDFLEYGLLYAHISEGAYTETSPSVLNFCFPITPIRLGAGYVVGKERIVSARGGRFGFGEKEPLYAVVYGVDGLRKPDVDKNVTQDGKTYCELSLSAGEVAIVLRKN